MKEGRIRFSVEKAGGAQTGKEKVPDFFKRKEAMAKKCRLPSIKSSQLKKKVRNKRVRERLGLQSQRGG